MNQHLIDRTLYNSPVGGPNTELRTMGDRLVLYTEDNIILIRFRSWEQLLYWVPYSKGGQLIAADLYFPKSAQKSLLRALSNKRPWTAQMGGSIR